MEENKYFTNAKLTINGKEITDLTCIEFTKEEYDEIKKLMPEDYNIIDIDYHEAINLHNTPEIDYKELLKKYMKLHMKDKKQIVLTFDLFTNNEMDQILNLEAEILNEPLQNDHDNNNKD